MSEQQENNNETSEQPVATAPADPEKNEQPPRVEPVKTAKSEPSTAPPARRGGFIAWLALLLGLALAAGAALVVQQAQQREAQVLDRIAGLESVTAGEQANLDAAGQRLRQELDGGITALKSQLAADLDSVVSQTASQSEQLQQLESQLAEQREEMARFSAADREDWLLAEAEYLLRLANQRLIMTGDVAAAKALLSSADAVLLQLDDVGLHGTRAAVAADLAALRAVPKLDVEGLYLRLAALADQAGALVIFELPDVEAQPDATPADDWQGRLEQGYESALIKLSDYIIIRRRDAPMQSLMDPQWEGLVRQNLRMLLEQAQVALLSSNQLVYTESLQRAEHWVAEFLESDEMAASAMAREIAALKGEQIAVQLPDISRSLRAVDDAMATRVQNGGEG